MNCAILSYYAAYSGNSLPMFQDNLLVLSWRVKNSWLLKMGLIGCPEMLVRNYQYILHNSTDECKSHLLRGRSLKSHTKPQHVSTITGCPQQAHFQTQNSYASKTMWYKLLHIPVTAFLPSIPQFPKQFLPIRFSD